MGSLAGGGAEKSAITIAQNWPEEDRCVLLVGLKQGPFLADAVASVDVVEVGARPSLNPFRFVRFALKFRRAVFRHGIDVVVSNGFGLNHAVLLTRRLLGPKKLVVVVVQRSHTTSTINALGRTLLSRIVRRKLTQALYPTAEQIIGISSGVARDLETLLRMPKGGIETIYNPIDSPRLDELMHASESSEVRSKLQSLRRPIYISVGRLVTQKAQHVLIEAFAMLPDEARGSLVILGEGPRRNDLEHLSRALGVDQHVWMPGFRANPWWIMARSDVFVLSSISEGFGRVLAEALVCGLPVVSTDCPSGPREILEGVQSSRLVAPGDPEALAIAMQEILGSRDSDVWDNAARFVPEQVSGQYRDVVLRASTISRV